MTATPTRTATGRGAEQARTGSVTGKRRPHFTASRLTFSEVGRRACGNWPAILPALGIADEHLRKGKRPCPGCGGTDRFRFINEDQRGDRVGLWVCNGGAAANLTGGDGFDLLCHVHGYTRRDALHAVSDWLGDDVLRSKLEPVRTPSREPERAWTATMPVPADMADGYLGLRHHELGTPAHWWPYESARGELMFAVARFETAAGKAVRPASFGRYDASERPAWRWKRSHVLIPMNLPELYLRPDAPVVVVEGEKAAEAAGVLLPEYVATCGHGGAHQAHLTHWGHLSRRDVLLWPDDDAASVDTWAPTLAGILRNLGCTVAVADPIRVEEAA